MMFFDPLYLILIAPAFLFAMWAQMKVKSAFKKGGQYRPRSGLSGSQTARRILDQNGLNDIQIERAKSWLGDHYDPKHRVVRLSPEVYDGQTLSALGVAAHEVGHALQQATSYAPLAIRNSIVPMASIGTNMAFILFGIGMFIQSARILMPIGIILFTVVVAFQLINLPVEFNASRRARVILLSSGSVTAEEDQLVAQVLNAAAMTYVAATLMAIVQLLYMILRVRR